MNKKEEEFTWHYSKGATLDELKKAEIQAQKEYGDIINLPHHVSKNHPQMSIKDRAAQFSPFAALTGYEEAVKEVKRLTHEKIQIDEEVERKINNRLNCIYERINEHPLVSITYFKKDDKKEGGDYLTIRGRVEKIKTYERKIIFEDEIISFDNIYDIDIITDR
ncbi:hypothetical protein SAMN05216249_12314 [Acetitomaculum ruminis DSM 5522]|uniref:YolD-like protein n=1 Tax=Acetitomaculum ruminis DSM 5522 TaxID=1120918 RepID=A0A1I1ADJ5_9FIRM|nr:YolD-like family protein [Acetitomaculum ruminis]SFB34550.1 hypothetical protein SAMN05216249_12314 [Acetitomaculum ruminis DSM 5522]